MNLIKLKLPEHSHKILNNIATEEVNILVKLFMENKYEIRIAGGAVRDILNNIVPHDIDFATTATPEQMKSIFNDNQIRMINTNGEAHGTITARINDKENFEVTTLRIDKVTDGRRAEVEFVKDWAKDAERRDLTINSLFLDFDGTVYDYFNGIDDLKNRQIRFVGNASKRIQEDYLRILRYFRFYGRISDKPDKFIPDILNTIKINNEGLSRISGERIWMELSKIISGNFASEILQVMRDCDVFQYIGFTENVDLTFFQNHYNNLRINNANVGSYLGAIINTQSELSESLNRLKFSNEILYIIHYFLWHKSNMNFIPSNISIVDQLKDEYIMWSNNKIPQPHLKSCQIELLKCLDYPNEIQKLQNWVAPKFPVKGNILSRKWSIKGREVGNAINFLKKKWKETDFIAQEADLITDSYKTEFFSQN